MTRTVEKVAVSLDHDLMARSERLRQSTGESRSALVSRALRRMLDAEDHAERLRRYVEAYRTNPERPPELEQARTLARRALAALPWDAT
jgi:metal-responsive CopG/Arc/MetJ family transcriptional regulator